MEKLNRIELDLDTYKIQLQFHGKKEPLAIHFDTPSRRFYFALIALIVNEMKNKGKSDFIHIRNEKKTLQLLDKSLAAKHASKNVDDMWNKIRVAWRHRLPDLEAATLFKIKNRDLIQPYEKGGKYKYSCSDGECDIWANLFQYDENNPWRFKFAIDSVSLSLNDISVSLGDLRDNSAWQEFVKKVSIQPKAVSREKRAAPRWWKNAAFSLVAVLIVGVATVAIWNSYMRPVPQATKLELPDKPSIAVLPFDNLSEDPSQEYFSDGMTDQIITCLSKISSLFVIARNSTFTYKGKPVKIQQVSEELGVRYVLEGSVQKSDDRVRVNAQLIDAIKGSHLWSETYDRELKDIFAVQDDITQKILTALQVQLTRGEQARIFSRGTNNLKAYLKYLQAYEKWIQMNRENNALARSLAEESIALDPDYPLAYLTLASTHMMDVFLGSSKSPKDSLKQAMALNKKAQALDDSLAIAHSQLGLLYTMTRQHDKGVAEAERGVELDPNSAVAHDLLGMTLAFAGRFEEAIPMYKKAIRLAPFAPAKFYYHLGAAYLHTGQCDEAISACEEAIRRASNSQSAHLFVTAVYSTCGREEEARAAAAEVLRINPNFSCDYFAKKGLPYKNQADIDLIIGALRKAGLK